MLIYAFSLYSSILFVSECRIHSFSIICLVVSLHSLWQYHGYGSSVHYSSCKQCDVYTEWNIQPHHKSFHHFIKSIVLRMPPASSFPVKHNTYLVFLEMPSTTIGNRVLWCWMLMVQLCTMSPHWSYNKKKGIRKLSGQHDNVKATRSLLLHQRKRKSLRKAFNRTPVFILLLCVNLGQYIDIFTWIWFSGCACVSIVFKCSLIQSSAIISTVGG